MRRAVVALAYLALLSISYFAAAKKPRSGNGIRLVEGSGSTGRLEISSTTPWLLTDGETIAWRPVCAVGGLIDNVAAQIMCQLLGYKYGRRHYSPDVVYRRPNASLSFIHDPVGYVYCTPNTGARRLSDNDTASGLASDAGASGDEQVVHERGTYPVVLQEGGGKAEVDFGSSGRRHRHARSLLASLYGTINIPATAPYRCQFRLGDCPYTGPLVGIECFNRRMPPAPPPPPSPPSPPPAPPPGSLSIRLFGPNGFPLEPNLCPSPEVCMYYNRVELQVRAPGSASGALVWAPLCAPLDLHLTGPVGDMVCWQVYNYLPGKVRPEFVVTSDPSITGFPLPNPTVAPGRPKLPALPTGPDVMSLEPPLSPSAPPPPQAPPVSRQFDPAGITAWATVTGANNYDTTARRVQDFDLEVSTTPCARGALFAVACFKRAGH